MTCERARRHDATVSRLSIFQCIRRTPLLGIFQSHSHSAYSVNFALRDFCPFPKLKGTMKRKRFDTTKDAKSNTTKHLKLLKKKHFRDWRKVTCSKISNKRTLMFAIYEILTHSINFFYQFSYTVSYLFNFFVRHDLASR